MKKILVLDNRGRFHAFCGEEINFHVTAEGCEIVNYSRDRDKQIAHFSQYQWIKLDEHPDEIQNRKAEFISHNEADKIPEDFKAPESETIDVFTRKALEEREEPKLDASELSSKVFRVDEKGMTLIDETSDVTQEMFDHEPEKQDVIAMPPPEKQKPVCETCGGAGTIQDPDSEDPLDTVMCPDC